MIALALPWVLGVAALAAVAVGVLHLLSVQRPPELLLPTTRFLPVRSVQAVSRTRTPSDLLLLAIRVLCVVSAGLAAAGPTWRSSRISVAHVVVVDREITRDTAAIRALLGVEPAAVTFVDDAERIGASNTVSAIWPVAWRTAALVATAQIDVDSIVLHLLVARGDYAEQESWPVWARQWPGVVHVHSPAAVDAHDSLTMLPVRTVAVFVERQSTPRGAADDAVVTSLRWHAARWNSARTPPSGRSSGAPRTSGTLLDTVVLIHHDSGFIATPDRASATESRARPLRVHWPMHGVPESWIASNPGDTSAALVTSNAALMGPWEVSAQPAENSGTSSLNDRWFDMAWWSDGRVAARERRVNGTCEREVAVVAPVAGDALLSASANAFFDWLLSPCTTRGAITMSAITAHDTLGIASAAATPFRTVQTPDRQGATPLSGLDLMSFSPSHSLWIPVLLFAALVLLAFEYVVRRRADAGGA